MASSASKEQQVEPQVLPELRVVVPPVAEPVEEPVAELVSASEPQVEGLVAEPVEGYFAAHPAGIV